MHWPSGKEDVAFYIQSDPSVTVARGENIGQAYQIGSVHEKSGSTYMASTGSGISGSVDSFFFNVRNQYIEDESIVLTVKIDLLESPHQRTKSGLMIRQGLDPQSKNLYCFLRQEKGAVFSYREAYAAWTQEKTVGVTADNSKTDSAWLRLRKEGSQYTCSRSNDGVSYFQIGTARVEMDDFYTGHALVSSDINKFAETVISNYSEADSASVPIDIADGTDGTDESPQTYAFIPFKDSPGNNIGTRSGSLASQMEWCDNNPRCKGFKTNGSMKKVILPESQLSTWTTDPDKGLYVKVTESEESGECEDRDLPGTWGVNGVYTCDTYSVEYCAHAPIKHNCCMCK